MERILLSIVSECVVPARSTTFTKKILQSYLNRKFLMWKLTSAKVNDTHWYILNGLELGALLIQTKTIHLRKSPEHNIELHNLLRRLWVKSLYFNSEDCKSELLISDKLWNDHGIRMNTSGSSFWCTIIRIFILWNTLVYSLIYQALHYTSQMSMIGSWSRKCRRYTSRRCKQGMQLQLLSSYAGDQQFVRRTISVLPSI